MPYEKFFKRNEQISFNGFDKSKFITKNPINDDATLFRKIRKGLAHFNVINSNGRVKIYDEVNGVKNFEVEMKEDDFFELIKYVGTEYLSMLK